MSEPSFVGPAALVIALEAAVPLWVLELQRLSEVERDRVRMIWAREGADEISAHGDILQYGGGKRGDVAKAFNHLARGLAAAAFQPGGVDFAGMHFEATEPECTGLTARWCPIHGDCSCPRDEDGDGDGDLDGPRCTLHSPNSSHPDGRTTSRAARGDTRWPPKVVDAVRSL